MREYRLIDICKPKQWKTLSIKELKSSGYPVYGANGVVGFHDEYTHERPTLLITCRGATCGELNISQPYSYVNGNAMALDGLNEDCFDLKYLYYVLKKRGLSDVITGSAQPQITRASLSNVSLSFPDIKEQKQIASILDISSELIDKRKQALAKVDELVQAMFLDMFGDPVSNERGWEKGEFNQFILNIESGWSPVCKAIQASDDEWGVLKLSAVTSGSYIASENKALLEETTPKPNLEVSKGDLLFVRKNTLELVGTCSFVFDTPSKLMLPDTMFRFVLKEDCKMNKLFLWQLLNNPKYKKQIQKLAGGTAGSMPNISKSKLLNFEVIYPDPELQSKFSAIVHKIELQKRKQFQSLQQLETNFQVLLQKAFKGELKVKDGVAV